MTKSDEKQLITVAIGEKYTAYGRTRMMYEDLDVEQSIDSLIQNIQAIKEKYEGQYTNLHFSDYDDDGYTKFRLYGSRLETDEEFAKRQKSLQFWKNKKTEEDRKKLEELKKLYPEEFK